VGEEDKVSECNSHDLHFAHLLLLCFSVWSTHQRRADKIRSVSILYSLRLLQTYHHLARPILVRIAGIHNLLQYPAVLMAATTAAAAAAAAAAAIAERRHASPAHSL